MNRTDNYRSDFVLAVLLILAIGVCGSCSKKPTGDNNVEVTGTLTVNLTAPAQEDVNGHPAEIVLLNSFGDTTAVMAVAGQITDGTAQLVIPEIPADSYQVMVAIRHDTSAFPVSGTLEDFDYFWMGLNVAISDSVTIDLSQYHWQRYAANAILVAVTGIPSEYDGKIVGGGLFPDGYDVLATSTPQVGLGSAGYVRNGSVVLSIYSDSELGFDPIPTADYDMWCVVDMNGTPDIWFAQNGRGSFEDGDLIAHFDFAYAGADQSQWYNRPATFEVLQASTLTLNLSVPAELGQVGKGAYVYVFPDFGESHVALGHAVVEAGITQLKVDMFKDGTYQLLVVLDDDDSYQSAFRDIIALSPGDYMWGTLDLNVTGDRTIAISDSAWQHLDGFIYAAKGIPEGSDGKPFAIGIYNPGEGPLNVHHEPLFTGVGIPYNNSTMICLHSTEANSSDVEGTMPVGDFDAWMLADADGHMSDYAGDTVMHPASIGDQYHKFQVSYDEETRYGDFQIADGGYLPFVAITGDIDCPDFSGNNIYVFLFRENPLAVPNQDPLATFAQPEPGWYAIPFYSNDSIYVVAFWDADNSGGEDGPTAGDLLGAYGVPNGGDLSTDMARVQTTTLASANKDFELWMAYSGPTLVRRH